MSFSDDFNDNSLDTERWEITKYGTATIAEQNQRIEVSIEYNVTEQWGGGLVTKGTYDLSWRFDVGIDVFPSGLSGDVCANLIIATEKKGNVTSAWDAELAKYVDFGYSHEIGEIRVFYRNNGSENEIVSKPITNCFGLRIKGEPAKLTFYYKDSEGGEWIELGTWDKPSDMFDMSALYVYFTGSTCTGSGTIAFDNFSLEITTPTPSEQLQETITTFVEQFIPILFSIMVLIIIMSLLRSSIEE